MSRLGPVSSSAGRKPGTPTIGSASAGDGQATVTFTAPTYLGKPDSSLTYTVVSSPSSISNTGSTSPITVTGLSNGTAYTFTVKLSNTVLDSEFSSSSNSVSPAAAGPNFAAPNFPNFPNFAAPNFPNFVAPNFPNFVAPNFPNFVAPNFVAAQNKTCTAQDVTNGLCGPSGCCGGLRGSNCGFTTTCSF